VTRPANVRDDADRARHTQTGRQLTSVMAGPPLCVTSADDEDRFRYLSSVTSVMGWVLDLAHRAMDRITNERRL
jgi:hypothetical protein